MKRIIKNRLWFNGRPFIIVARGHNRQFSPYFHSDLHAEMDLLNRYEDRVKALRTEGNPRRVEGLVLFSSVEPCPMCLTRIINFGVAKTYYAAPDPTGGMVHKLDDLPPFWKEAAAGRIYAEADCSPALKALAARLFAHGRRNIKTKQEVGKTIGTDKRMDPCLECGGKGESPRAARRRFFKARHVALSQSAVMSAQSK